MGWMRTPFGIISHKSRSVGSPEEGVFVVWGEGVTIAEGQVYWMLQNHLKEVPAPEIYGWRTDGNQVFLYLEHIEGEKLEDLEVENKISAEEFSEIYDQIKPAKLALSRLRQDPRDVFLGKIGRQPLLVGRQPVLDIDNNCKEDDDNFAGPFPTVAAFHDWLTDQVLRKSPDPEPIMTLRKVLPDNAPIVFSHNNLFVRHIIVSSTKPLKVLAIVGWQHSGWYPSYWEQCRATRNRYGTWAFDYLPKLLKSSEYSDELLRAFWTCMERLGLC
ncbi:hypothetical protein TWF718_004009 [Orbilia javanica]|uniref:Aminoglycoside phosphotransferase domain-containing protein n=1 Tax=Orbilia javanica TaxID=47235 RepID=A0AAN8MUB6_9PEZI